MVLIINKNANYLKYIHENNNENALNVMLAGRRDQGGRDAV